MSEILKLTSFGLVRTNPKLTTNVKIVADSKDKVYLESIDADPLLSKSIYKGFEVTGGSYSRDLNRFYSQGSSLLPKSIAYKTYEIDDSTGIKDRYKSQYDFTYAMGMTPKNSRLYTEEFSLFFPLWVEPSNIPDYFLIFKIDGPVAINSNDPTVISQVNTIDNGDFDASTYLEYMTSDPDNFWNNFIKKSKIIKTFDLTQRTAIGRYIRQHAKDPLFPESSMYASLKKGDLTYWQGMSYNEGGFCKKGQDIYTDFTLIDKTIIESEDFLTMGFQTNSVIHPNVLNLEFLFDDEEQDKYKFSRYFGLYVSEAQLGQFEIDGNALFVDKNYEVSQTPAPIKNNFGYANNTTDQIQYNDSGIKVYPKVLSYTHPSTTGPTGAVIFNGRLINFEETQYARIPYVKDTMDNFYSINATNDWSSTYAVNPTGPTGPVTHITYNSFLRLKNDKVNWKNFSGFEDPYTYIGAIKTDKKGRPNFSFRVIGEITTGDQIRIKETDWTDSSISSTIDYYTVTGNFSLPAGTNLGLSFSTKGTNTQIASAIAKAINYISVETEEHQIFEAISINDRVIVFTRLTSENWNSIKYTMFSSSITFPWSLPNKFLTTSTISYLPSPIAYTTGITGKYFESTFTGGCDNPNARFIVSVEDLQEMKDENDPVYLKTTIGFDKADKYSFYVDEPVFDSSGKIISFNNIEKYVSYHLEDTTQSIVYTSERKLALYHTAKNSNGYLSIYPIKDFDFDFFDTSYSKSADSNIDELYSWYTTSFDATFSPTFDYSALDATSRAFIDSMIGPTSSFYVGGGFQTLSGEIDDLLDQNIKITSEYDRLNENVLPELALSSRVVPFINKWVYDNDYVDVRENPYRLNSDQSFGYSNFSPSFDDFNSNSKFFTHEWYYLQEYPPYMSFEEKLNSFSYFDGPITVTDLPFIGSSGSTAYYNGLTGATGASANLLSIAEDYFLSYFTRETIGGTAIPRDFKYSQFEYGSSAKHPETLFRGVKINIKERTEYSSIDYNIESLKFLPSSKYNGYKFSALLTYSDVGSQISVIKNDKFESVTMLIQANLKDSTLLSSVGPSGTTRFIDRASLYTLKDKYTAVGATMYYSDVQLSGRLNAWTWDATNNYWVVTFVPDQNGNYPDLAKELSLNENGGYNDIVCDYTLGLPGTGTFTFQGVSNPTVNTFTCTSILTSGSIPAPLSASDNLLIDLSLPTPLATVPASWLPYTLYWSTLTSPWIVSLISPGYYLSGGYNAYVPIIESISFAAIANSINSGSPEIKYVNVDENGVVSFNQFALELSRPDLPVKSTYLKSTVLTNKPTELQTSSGILGYTLTSTDRVILNQLSRCRGGYNPKTKDLIKFIDLNDIKSEGLSYNNVEILTTQPDFKLSNGNIQNINFNKVNVQSPDVILKFNQGSLTSIYPLIGEIAIDHKDLFTFKSSWDAQYYNSYPKANTTKSIIGTREPKENKSFFGSKVIAIPNDVRLETFPSGIITSSELRDPSKIDFVPQNLVTTETTIGTNKYLSIDVYTELALEDWLIADGFGSDFYQYINPNYSFGNPGQVDDIKDYIEENIYLRYVVKEVILWEKYWKKGDIHPNVQTGLSDVQKIQAGYVKTKNFQTKFTTQDDLNFQLIYNIPQDRNYSIAITVVLEKK